MYIELPEAINNLFRGLLLAVLRRRREPLEPAPILALPAPPRPHEEYLSVPMCDTSRDDSAVRDAQDRGQFLARQERWEVLADELRDADQARLTTPGGVPITELLAFGARSDVVLGTEHMLLEGAPDVSLDGVRALETVRREFEDDPAINLVVAMAHLDIGWAWRGTGWDATLPKLHRQRCAAHFDRAVEILAPFNGLELKSPMIAAANCALLAVRPDARMQVADMYEQLIDLDPHNPRHMRALGHHLLPRRFGSLDALELEAHRTAARTTGIWGAGGYTWVMFDAIAVNDEACARVNVDFFVDGLRDIVARRPDQETINLLAAYCAITLRHGQGGSTEADLPRLQIVDCASWLIRDHLTEVHPLLWAHAAAMFDNAARVTSLRRFANRGRDHALRAIADLFSDEIASGCKVTFTPEGPRLGRRPDAA